MEKILNPNNMEKSEEALEVKEAYQKFCQKDGITENEKERAKAILAAGTREYDWERQGTALQFGASLLHYGDLLKSMEGKVNPLDACHAAVEDLATIQMFQKYLHRVEDSLFLTEPKLDKKAGLAVAIHIAEPGEFEPNVLLAELRDPAKREAYHREGNALVACVDHLVALRDATTKKMATHPEEIAAKDAKELLMKTRDIIGAYECNLKEDYAAYPAPSFKMGSIDDQESLLIATEPIHVLRNRAKLNPKETLAEKTMRDVFSSNPDNFDYCQLTTMAVTKLMGKGASNKTIKETVAVGREVCPSIGDTKTILKDAEKRQQDITLNTGH